MTDYLSKVWQTDLMLEQTETSSSSDSAKWWLNTKSSWTDLWSCHLSYTNHTPLLLLPSGPRWKQVKVRIHLLVSLLSSPLVNLMAINIKDVRRRESHIWDRRKAYRREGWAFCFTSPQELFMKAPQWDVRFRFCISAESVTKDHWSAIGL